jgi:hypothetical protein
MQHEYIAYKRSVILSGAYRSFIARGAVEGPAVASLRRCLPFCLSFRGEAKESAVARVFVFLVPLPEGNLPSPLPVLCHSAAKRRNLLLLVPLPFLL